MRGAYVCSAQHTGDGSGSGRARPGFFDLTEQIWDMFLAAVAMFHTLQIPVVFSFLFFFFFSFFLYFLVTLFYSSFCVFRLWGVQSESEKICFSFFDAYFG